MPKESRRAIIPIMKPTVPINRKILMSEEFLVTITSVKPTIAIKKVKNIISIILTISCFTFISSDTIISLNNGFFLASYITKHCLVLQEIQAQFRLKQILFIRLRCSSSILSIALQGLLL